MAKKTEEKSNGLKKYIAKAVLVGSGSTVHVGGEIELTDEQAKRLLELDAIEAPEVE
jgi:hypothetical protein